jgi:antibiotic biosynthesis monooxygenase (ABM) superfamily enzyme
LNNPSKRDKTQERSRRYETVSEKTESPALKPKQKWKRIYWWVIYALLSLQLILAIRHAAYGADPEDFGRLIGSTIMVALVLYGVISLVMRMIQGRR